MMSTRDVKRLVKGVSTIELAVCGKYDVEYIKISKKDAVMLLTGPAGFFALMPNPDKVVVDREY